MHAGRTCHLWWKRALRILLYLVDWLWVFAPSSKPTSWDTSTIWAHTAALGLTVHCKKCSRVPEQTAQFIRIVLDTSRKASHSAIQTSDELHIKSQYELQAPDRQAWVANCCCSSCSLRAARSHNSASLKWKIWVLTRLMWDGRKGWCFQGVKTPEQLLLCYSRFS